METSESAPPDRYGQPARLAIITVLDNAANFRLTRVRENLGIRKPETSRHTHVSGNIIPVS
jgi:hypothetical protein